MVVVGTHAQSIQLGRKPTDLEIANEVKAMRKREREEALLTKKRKAAEVGDRGDHERMKRLEEMFAAQDERLKKVEGLLNELHARVAFSPLVVPPAPKHKGTKRRTAEKEKDKDAVVALKTEQAVDAATETEEASNASTESEGTPKEARMEVEEEVDATMAGKEVADAAMESEDGASVDTETREADDAEVVVEDAARAHDVESVSEGSIDVSKRLEAPKEEKVPSETPDAELEVVETMAQVSTEKM